jgi:hypothetical protein
LQSTDHGPGWSNSRVYLADVRERLSDVDRATFDAAIWDLQRDRRIFTLELQDPRQMTDRHRDAAVRPGIGSMIYPIAYLTQEEGEQSGKK